MNKLECIFGIMAAIELASCSSDEPAVEEQIGDFGYQAIELSRAEKQIADANYVFGWNLLEKADVAQPDENVCVSPVSANVVLTMLINGAEGETRTEILNTLGLDGMSLDEINDNSRFMTTRLLKNDKDVEIYMANSMWIVDGTPVKTSFKSSMTNVFDAYVTNTTSSNYVSEVNAWCSKQTKGLIPEMVEEDEHNDLALLNALYFKNIWDRDIKFNSDGNKKFNNSDGSESNVPFMSGKIECGYNETNVAKYARIAFKDYNYALLIGLPREEADIKECISELKDIGVLNGGYKKASIDFCMPKFCVEGKQSLKEMMIALGVDRVFGGKAQLPYISDVPMYVSRFDQGVSFKVDEKGAVASAVTNAGVVSWSSYAEVIDEPMVVDRPFVFAVYEYSTKCVLFAGKIEVL